MGKKYFLFIGIGVLIIAGGIWFAVSQKPSTPQMQQEMPQALGGGAVEQPPYAQELPPEELGEGGGGAVPPPELPPQDTARITYDGTTYAPTTVEIKKGESVLFINQSQGSMWPASAMHPTHTAYPTTGGCIGSTFDACQEIPQGAMWSFVFDEPGEWKYHDHLNTNARGVIVVK